MANGAATTIYERLAGEGAQDAPPEEARNALRHMGSLSMTKLADGLIDPKLVLSWLLTHLGAPGFFVGLLVPIREAGALLPQLFAAPRIRAMAERKWAWAAGSAVQGLAAAGIAVAAVVLQGWAAGVGVAGLLALLAVARSVCSVSYKDVLGKTVAKTRRGAVTGVASSVSAFGVLVFAGLLMSGLLPRTALVTGAIALAAGLWLVAAALFARLEEPAEPGEAESMAVFAQFALLRQDPQLALFILVRGFLVATALAPPFLILLAAEGGAAGFDRLGALVLASSLASFASSYVWGRLSDRSSRKVLMLAGLAGASAMAAALALHALGLTGAFWALPGVLFVLMVAHHGVRQGRSTYLVDMAPEDRRAAYTAVANTLIGLILLASGLVGALAAALGAVWAIVFLGASAALGAVAALWLKEVERDA